LSVTRTRDLRDGKPVWAAYKTPSLKVTPLRRSVRTEVVIVGSGVSGAMMAQALTEAGIKPLIVDRRRNALLGSTAASTALLQFELDTPLIRMAATEGRRNAERIWCASRDAVNELRTRTHRLGIAAHFETRPSLYLAGNLLDARGLVREVAARQRMGLASEYLDRRALRHHFGIDRAGAILSHGNAEANPVELAAGYLRKALAAGARLHAPTEIAGVVRTRGATTLVAEDGVEIEARHVIFCTGYELLEIVPRTATRILSTWAIATKPQPLAIWPQRALIWEASEPYLYVRSTTDGRVICGGEDADIADAAKRDALTRVKAARIQVKLQRLLPALDARAAFIWSGSFGGSPTGTPTIGEIPNYPRCYAVMGFGGNGITFSMLATKLITAAIMGRKLPEARLFRFEH
jgi:glycine/D-amino acid oxidase-like deaminating enzyme